MRKYVSENKSFCDPITRHESPLKRREKNNKCVDDQRTRLYKFIKVLGVQALG